MVAKRRPEPRRRAAPDDDEWRSPKTQPALTPATSHKNQDATNTQNPSRPTNSAPSPSPDGKRYAARAAAPKAVARLYSESRVAEKRANQAEREATSLRRTIDASSEIARRRNALLRNGGSWLNRGGDDVEAPKGGVPLPGLSEVGPPPPPSQDASPLPAHIEERLRQLQLPDAWAGEVRDLIQQSRDEAQRDVVDVEFDVDSTPPPSPEGEVWPSWTSPHKTTPPARSPRRPPPNRPSASGPPRAARPRLRAAGPARDADRRA